MSGGSTITFIFSNFCQTASFHHGHEKRKDSLETRAIVHDFHN